MHADLRYKSRRATYPPINSPKRRPAQDGHMSSTARQTIKAKARKYEPVEIEKAGAGLNRKRYMPMVGLG